MISSSKLRSLMVASLLFSTVPAFSANDFIKTTPLPQLNEQNKSFAENELIVTFKKDVDIFENIEKNLAPSNFINDINGSIPDFMKEFNNKFKDKLDNDLGHKNFKAKGYKELGAMHIKSDKNSTEELIKYFKSDEMKEYVESVSKNNIIYLTSSNDSYYNQLWAIENNAQEINSKVGSKDADMDVVEAWSKTKGEQSIIVAVLDTGVDYTHSDLQDNMWNGEAKHGFDFAGDNDGNNDDDPMPDKPFNEQGHYHGTHVAGIIGAVGDNENGISGVAQHLSIMALKVFRPNGYGYTSDVLEALNYISERIDKGDNIVAINASYGGPGGSQDDAVNLAIKKLGEQGVLFCAAAGNTAKDIDVEPIYPASYDAPNIISVAASDQDDNLASFSNYGVKSVDVAAPGTNILSTYPDNNYAFMEGTSMATPNVTGTIALIASLYADSTVAQRKEMILNNVDVKSSLNKKVSTSGRININKTLNNEQEVVNTAPIANDDATKTMYETTIKIDVLENDKDEDDDTLTIESVSNPANGLVSIENNLLIYTPKDNFSGKETFDYTISDGKLKSTASVSILVEEKPNSAPIAKDDEVTTNHETEVSIDILNNDSDKDNDILTIESVTTPTYGSVKIDNHRIIYTPKSAFSGEDKFEYTISDGKEKTTASVIVNVKEALNSAPIAHKDTVTTKFNTPVSIDVLKNDKDEDNDRVKVVSFTQPLHGNVEEDEKGNLTYTPQKDYSGSDSFNYTISDGKEEANSTVSIEVKEEENRNIKLPVFEEAYNKDKWQEVDISTDKITFKTKEDIEVEMKNDDKNQLVSTIKKDNKESKLTINIPNRTMKINSDGATIIEFEDKSISIEIDKEGNILPKFSALKNAVLPQKAFPLGTELTMDNEKMKFTLPFSKNIKF